MTTQYSHLSISDLHGLFSHDTWASLSSDERLHACQEVEDRYAAEKGVAPCLVYKESMDGATYGYFTNRAGQGTIALNASMLDRGEFDTDYYDNNGNKVGTFSTPVSGWGWNVLDTIYHEGTHGKQDAIGEMHDTYIGAGGVDDKGRTVPGDYSLYRIGPEEREAFDEGNARTLSAILMHESKTGIEDADKNDYIQSILASSYQSALQEAQAKYQDVNIQDTLDQVINDRDQGIQRSNPSASYKAIEKIVDDYDYYAAHYKAENLTASTNLDDSKSTIKTTTDNLNNHKDDGLNTTGTHNNHSLLTLDDGLHTVGTHGNSISSPLDDGLDTVGTHDTSSPQDDGLDTVGTQTASSLNDDDVSANNNDEGDDQDMEL